MKDLNRVILVGRLVKDVELRYTPTGLAVAKFSIANNDSYMQNQERKEIVSYFDIVVWGNMGINCDKYLRKGSSVIVEGKLRQNRWVDQTSGKNQSKIEIVADFVHFNSSPQQQGTSGTPQNSYNQPSNSNNREQSQQPKQRDSSSSKPQNQSSDFNADPWVDVPFNGGDEGYDGESSSDDDIPF